MISKLYLLICYYQTMDFFTDILYIAYQCAIYTCLLTGMFDLHFSFVFFDNIRREKLICMLHVILLNVCISSSYQAILFTRYHSISSFYQYSRLIELTILQHFFRNFNHISAIKIYFCSGSCPTHSCKAFNYFYDITSIISLLFNLVLGRISTLF